jgi:excisionase family DNA binding protein
MHGQLEAAVRDLLKSVLREVIREVLPPPQPPTPSQNNPRSDAEDKMLLTGRETAKVLGISARTLFKLTANGELPCVKLERLVRYNRDTLREWIEQKESAAKTKRAQRVAPAISNKQKDSPASNAP